MRTTEATVLACHALNAADRLAEATTWRAMEQAAQDVLRDVSRLAAIEGCDPEAAAGMLEYLRLAREYSSGGAREALFERAKEKAARLVAAEGLTTPACCTLT